MEAVVRRVCGIALIVVGLVAIPIPIVPGFLLIAAGAAMLRKRQREEMPRESCCEPQAVTR